MKPSSQLSQCPKPRLGQNENWKSLLFGVEPRWGMLLTSLLAANCMNYGQEWAPEGILHFLILLAPVLSEQARPLQNQRAEPCCKICQWWRVLKLFRICTYTYTHTHNINNIYICICKNKKLLQNEALHGNMKDLPGNVIVQLSWPPRCHLKWAFPR